MQSKESSDANSELFKEDDDEAMYKNPYEIRLCYLISVSQDISQCILYLLLGCKSKTRMMEFWVLLHGYSNSHMIAAKRPTTSLKGHF